ncbi:MAG TPA: PQQ-binding-like beta-propeller repeat protein [Vicinamibacterales bacterium]|jgi:PQQ-dependent dehydrogenase (methanol/ethanol family)|nr:PQQ-binding-like beta-propeller repeat protein [Vicinamibacterales bacterium]
MRTVSAMLGIAVLMSAAAAAPRAANTVAADWPSYNRTLTSDRYAPLDQINKNNISRLKQLCVHDLDVDVNFQAGPIVIGRTMYLTADREILALDAATCQQKWRVREDSASTAPRVNRGVAYLDGRLFRGTGDGDVIAYDAATGKRVWRTHLADPEKGESVPAAPIAWNGLIFIGTAGSERYGVRGRIYALDAAAGTRVWETYTVPTDAPQPGNEAMQKQARATWGNAEGIPITGGGTWTSYTLDPERGLLYIPVGNPGPDFATEVRHGTNLYTNSILVLDAKTGIYRNHYSLVPADFHDWDLGAAPVLATTRSGKRIVAGAPKDGLLHVYDLTSNAKLFATPITTRQNDTVPLSTTALHFCPGSSGGSEWNGPAFSPDTNLFYDGTADWCTTLAIDLAQLARKPGQTWTGSDLAAQFGKHDANWAGWVVATDADTGQVKWRFHAPAPVLSGITPTKGGLVFAGDMDEHAYAFDANTGSVVWRADLPGAAGGGVITYMIDGRQYVAFVAGTRSNVFPVSASSAKIVVFGL